MYDFTGKINYYAKEIAETHEKVSELLQPMRRDFIMPYYQELYEISELLRNAESCSRLLAVELAAQADELKKPWYKTIFRK